MRKIVTMFMLVATVASNAQNKEYAREFFLEEKVRDTQLRHLIESYIESPSQVNADAIDSYLERRSTERADDSLTGGAEPFIALHPTNNQLLALSYMESGNSFEYPVYYSTDAGATWDRSNFSPVGVLNTEFPGDQVLGGGDPVLAFDEDGTLHMTWIYLHGQGFSFNAGMFYAYSSDGGQTFTVPATDDHVIFDGTLLPTDMLDRQWMHVDNSGGPYDGNLYMSAIYFGGALGGAGEVVMTKPADSTGFNMTPTIAVPITGNEAAQFGNVKVDPNGTVHLSCMKFDSNGGAGGVYYTNSTDGAQTFGTPVQVGTATTALPNSGNHLIHDRDNSATSMAVDGNNIYIAWSDMANNDVRGFFVHSNDGGTTFSTPFEFGVDLLDSTYYHLMPNVAADNGKVSISWYAVSKNDFMTNYIVTESTDGGATFPTYSVVSSAPTDFGNEGSGFYGDYNTSVKDDCFTYAAWSDGRSGEPVMYVRKVNTCQLGVEELSPVNGSFSIANLYPNPASDMITVELTSAEGVELQGEILDLQGRVVQRMANYAMNAGSEQMIVSLDDLQAGTYILRLVAEDGTFATRSLIVE